jgi:SnoaL-like polyketide cyclase
MVAARWVARGAHSGDGLGVPLSGKRIEIGGITIARFRDGKIVEGWTTGIGSECWNRLELTRRLKPLCWRRVHKISMRRHLAPFLFTDSS